MNLISVILPVKNNAAVLPTLLADLKRQTYRNFEVICVDNNSVDQTYQQLVAFKRLSGISTTIISQRMRQSVATSYNQALSQAHGQYIMFLNPKMRVHSAWLSQVSQNAVANGTDIVGYNGQNQQFSHTSDLIAAYLLGQVPMKLEGMLINRQLLRNIPFDPQLTLHAETMFLYSIYRQANSVSFLSGAVCPKFNQRNANFTAAHLQVMTVLESIENCIQTNDPHLIRHMKRPITKSL